MRARYDPAWVRYLLRVGNGLDFEGDQGEILLPDAIISTGSLVDEVYPHLFDRQMTNDELSRYLTERAIVAPLNQTCDQYNEEIVERLPGDMVEHCSVDEVTKDTFEDGVYHTTEFLNSLNPSELPPHRLKLKRGVVVMLLRNLRVHDGKNALTKQ
ncbi:DNA repair and recombination protein PIF1-like protein [Aphelenchoides avenae]|nr:DNA repair and recombination protein PIF1-like protein [Aphelenchus avenae]